MKRIKKGDLMPWFLEDHGQLPQWYLDDTEKFFKWLEKIVLQGVGPNGVQLYLIC